MSLSRADCYDLCSCNDPSIQDVALPDFDPLEYGFTVVEITKDEKCFVQRSDESTLEEGDESKIVFPQADAQPSSPILHSPSEVWGYDGNQLILGVVSSCHMSLNAWYIWYCDGIKIKEGNKNCCLPISSPGSYSVEVHSGEQKKTSEPVLVCNLSDSVSPSSFAADTSVNENVTQLPVVEKEEINFSAKDEIGRGSFGIVYKGVWAGTEVAVKHVKIPNARRLRSVMETEVRLHSMVRHPNIIQLMAISYLKNSIYLVSELIKGRNLEELLFSDDENSETFSIQSCNKLNMGKQISLAVAYLHNLKPPLVHRDIKPANVLVAKVTHITKLYDMGLSKLKSVKSLSQTTSTGIPGTPSYMAPECLLERKKATVHSDVWSLACTLVELFTEKDCWEQLLEDKKATAGKESAGLKHHLFVGFHILLNVELTRVCVLKLNFIDSFTKKVTFLCYQCISLLLLTLFKWRSSSTAL